MEELKDVKELLKFGIETVEAVDKSMVDKKLDMNDLVNFMGAMQTSGAAFQDVHAAVEKIKVLTVEEMQALKVYACDELQFTNEKVEVVVEKVLGLIVDLFTLVVKVKSLKQ